MNSSVEKKTLVLHPFLLAVYPILFLAAINAELFLLGDAITPLLLALAGAGVLFGLLYLWLKDARKAGLIVSVLAICFFAYGHVHEALTGVRIGSFEFGGQRFFRIGWLLAFAVVIYLLVRTKKNLRTLTVFANAMSVILIVLVVVQLIPSIFGGSSYAQAFGTETSESVVRAIPPDSLPDIYYIVLDGYGGAQTFIDLYNYDNNSFLDSLRSRGFYVPNHSCSNYPGTIPSLTSSLNMDYLTKAYASSDEFEADCLQRVKDNDVARFLKLRGYRYVNFSSGYEMTHNNPYADLNVDCGASSEFPMLVFYSTILKAFDLISSDIHDQVRHIKLCQFQKLAKVERGAAPNFVLGHIVAPHPPFLFGPNGEAVASKDLRIGEAKWTDRPAYVGQVRFVNKQILTLVDALLLKPGPRPIILIQGDHGPASLDQWDNPTDDFIKERCRILNAYYLPNGGDKHLYDSISPVNSFRIVFNHYFGGNFNMLEDRNYFFHPRDMVKQFDVTDRLLSKTDSTQPVVN